MSDEADLFAQFLRNKRRIDRGYAYLTIVYLDVHLDLIISNKVQV